MITVNPDNTVTVPSSTPTVCINTAITPITHVTTVATGIGVSSGLPPGLTANFSSNTITISGTPSASGIFNYSIPLIGGCGSVISATGTITIPPAIISSIQSQTNIACNNTGSYGAVVLSTSGGTGNLTYTWSPNVSTGVSANNLSAGTYTCTITDENNCTKIQQVIITEPDPVAVPLCLISVDTNSTHNIIYWEKPITALVDSFFIYREITTDTYSKIAAVAYEALSEYYDYEANPNLTSYKYKISVLDTCGFEGEQSDYHNSIHLLNLGNGNLLWTLYEIEHTSNPVTYYRVYRDDFGTNNFQPINSSIPGSNTTYTDVNYSSYPNAKYVVDVSWGISCTPFRSTAITSRSNQWSDNLVNIENELENQIQIFPNPANDNVTVEFSSNIKPLKIEIYNSLGELIFTSFFSKIETASGKIKIEVVNFADGIYTLAETSQSGKIFKKLIIQ